MVNPKHVFVNCPFDKGYKPIFDAIMFAVTDLGFFARSAKEEDDGDGLTQAEPLEKLGVPGTTEGA